MRKRAARLGGLSHLMTLLKKRKKLFQNRLKLHKVKLFQILIAMNQLDVLYKGETGRGTMRNLNMAKWKERKRMEESRKRPILTDDDLDRMIRKAFGQLPGKNENRVDKHRRRTR